jgi:hypothetical protein
MGPSNNEGVCTICRVDIVLNRRSVPCLSTNPVITVCKFVREFVMTAPDPAQKRHSDGEPFDRHVWLLPPESPAGFLPPTVRGSAKTGAFSHFFTDFFPSHCLTKHYRDLCADDGFCAFDEFRNVISSREQAVDETSTIRLFSGIISVSCVNNIRVKIQSNRLVLLGTATKNITITSLVALPEKNSTEPRRK